jgi:hypothetical protein
MPLLSAIIAPAVKPGNKAWKKEMVRFLLQSEENGLMVRVTVTLTVNVNVTDYSSSKWMPKVTVTRVYTTYHCSVPLIPPAVSDSQAAREPLPCPTGAKRDKALKEGRPETFFYQRQR